MNKDQILQSLQTTFTEMFDIEASRVVRSSHLINDFDLDSIDLVDMLAKLQEMTGISVRPEQFKSIRTVGDLVDTIEQLLQEAP